MNVTTSTKGITLGRLNKVDDVRSVWPDEALNFTPWLAEPENLEILGETIGIVLELEAQEKSVGPFKADILCKDTATSDWVLIENQLERTDHTHLGQLMTYAAGLKAVSIVWISRRFTEEHRAALDWLNEITDEDFNFFGLEIELWQIGDSPVAPKFNVVCKPNDWSRSVKDSADRSTSGELSEMKQIQLEFWTAFKAYLEENSTLRPTKPSPQHWMNFGIGRTGFYMSAIASSWNMTMKSYECEIRAEVSIENEDKGYFHALLQQKDKLDAAVGETLTPHNPEGTKSARFYLRKESDFTNKALWPEQHEWLRQKLEALRSAFGPIIKNLEPVPVPDAEPLTE